MRFTKIIKAAAIITICVIITGIAYDISKTSPVPMTVPDPKNESSINTDDKSDQEEGRRIMRSYAATYNSYRVGDVSNLTSLYPIMCDTLAKSERSKADNLQEKFKDYKEYKSVESQDKKSQVESYDENKIVVRVTIEKVTFNGAFVPDTEGLEGSYKMLDKNGQEYTGNKDDLIESAVTETYEVTGIKESSEWKVCEFQKIN